MKKTLPFIFLVIISTLFNGCASDVNITAENNEPKNTSAEDYTETTSTDKEWYDELDFSGTTIKILSQYGEWEAEDNGEVVNSALYNRKVWCEETLGLSLTPILTDESIVIDEIIKTVQAGDDTYDIINAAQYRMLMQTAKGVYAEMSEAPYLDFGKSCWADDYMKELSIGERIFFMTGDISLQFLHRTSLVYFNTSEYKNLTGEDKETLYKIVSDGQWTFDRLDSYLKDSYRDLNGNSTIDEADYFGTAVMTGSITEHLAFNSGVRYTEKNSDDIPVLVEDHTHTISVIDYIYKLFYETPAVVTYPASLESLDVTMVNKLAANEMVFMFGWFDTASKMRDMEADYGAIPYPKYDEAQTGYKALAHDNAGQFALPVSIRSEKFNAVCALLEAAAEYSEEYVTPAYYEVALKTKFMRDSESVKMLDMIKEAVTTDFGYAYNYAFGELGTITRTLMKTMSKDFVSLYTKNVTVYETKLADLIKTAEDASNG